MIFVSKSVITIIVVFTAILVYYPVSVVYTINDDNANPKTNQADYYTSLVGVQNLARQEQELVGHLIRYRKKLKARLDLVNAYLDDYSDSIHPLIQRFDQLRIKFGSKRFPRFKTKDDLELIAEKMSAHPIMVFKLLRRFAKELPDIGIDLVNDIETDFKNYIGNIPETMSLPTEHDLNGAADGLLRLQDTYQLPTRDITKGKLIDTDTGCRLRASDMQFISVRAFNTKLYAIAVQWLYEALQRIVNEGDISVPKDVVSEQLRFISDHHNRELLSFKTIPSNLFSNIINSNLSNIPGLYIPPIVKDYKLRIISDTIFDMYNFMALCRGEKLLNERQTKNLRCWYSRDSPYNIISPLKFEMHHENPPVYQVYDLLSDRVMNHIKNQSQPYLKRAQVVSASGGVNSDVRTSSVAWLIDQKGDHSMLSKVPKIVERATGLVPWAPNAAEDLQISCYGSVGGYYIPHIDALLSPEIAHDITLPDFYNGDRIATVMFYLSDVELGGGTAFPRLGVAAKAVKGSAVIWYNLKYNGERELLMLHGGCPVLFGNKWVANKWIRLYEQLHVRKCTKDRFE